MSTHGTKSQKKIGKKFIMILLIIAGIITILITVLNITVKKKNYTATNNQYEILKNIQYLHILEIDDDYSWEYSLDLKEKQYFGELKAIKSGEIYGTTIDTSIDTSTDAFFKKLSDRELSIFKKINVSNHEIEDAHFVIEREMKVLVDSKKKDYLIGFESDYLKHGLTKVRITYNKEYLPTKIEGYYEDEEEIKWKLIRKFSYPYKNQSEFNKELDEYIEYIKMYEEENEGD